ncbi:TetR family transcriptional regulator [Acinetobacter sp. ASP199]|uniref:TetR family transcriptional regulator n=1 Tax=unclassified Acinetobacter TaxID=196816 RepID=UPI001F6113CE|nr:TetR family transcriptional regulator [Acinetobacter sp. ASP199]UNT59307.1 TetR family transcriptional regulator [Acinetobacter sp. ASP199]
MSLREERKQQSHQAIIDAALVLSSRGRAFSNISLRELSREVGLVPTAFYRHFKDMQQLGLELLDQVALKLKSILNQLVDAYLHQVHSDTETSISLFFQAVEEHSEPWLFFSTERWGGSDFLRTSIERELQFWIADLVDELGNLYSAQGIEQPQHLKLLIQMLMDLSLNWAMGWLSIQALADVNLKQSRAAEFKAQTVIQMQLLFQGIHA